MQITQSTALRWLEGLPPGYFAVALASGILSIAFDMIGQSALAVVAGAGVVRNFCYLILLPDILSTVSAGKYLAVVMGAVAAGVNAGTVLLQTSTTLSFLQALHPFIDGMAMLLWSWAT